MVPQSAQQVIYPSPLQPVYQQMVQYQAQSPPQYYIPAQQINQSHQYNPYPYNVNGYENRNSMNGDQNNEYYNRGHNGRGNSRGHHWLVSILFFCKLIQFISRIIFLNLVIITTAIINVTSRNIVTILMKIGIMETGIETIISNHNRTTTFNMLTITTITIRMEGIIINITNLMKLIHWLNILEI